MDKRSIAIAIAERVESSKTVNYSAWRIGLTHRPQERAQQHQDEGHDVQHWMQWQADSLAVAQEVEAHFIHSKGMQGGTGGNLDSRYIVYVYIF